MDGETPAEKRRQKIAKFQAKKSSYFCFCLSTKTGHVGLTLTAANRVILLSPSWNPSDDEVS
jgi:SNF2 family DNA or RNA helicase